MENKEPIVSICCITYNQEKYISETIEGFLMQKTSFPIEIIIHDDASTDKTAEIIKQYVDKHPDLITPIFQTVNQYSKGIKPTTNFLYPKAKGKYIAICEGDDYWTDPYKLQKQVDFLEANEDYGMVCTDVLKYNQTTGKFIESSIAPFDGWIYEERFKEANQIWTVTVCFRKELLFNLPQLDTSKYFTGDIFLYFHLSLQSKVKFINEKTAVYRVLEESASHFKSQFKAIEFAYKVANTTLYYLKKQAITTNLYKEVFYKKMLAVFKYALVTKNFILFKTVQLNLPTKPSLKDILIQGLYTLCNWKPFFRMFTSFIKIK